MTISLINTGLNLRDRFTIEEAYGIATGTLRCALGILDEHPWVRTFIDLEELTWADLEAIPSLNQAYIGALRELLQSIGVTLAESHTGTWTTVGGVYATPEARVKDIRLVELRPIAYTWIDAQWSALAETAALLDLTRNVRFRGESFEQLTKLGFRTVGSILAVEPGDAAPLLTGAMLLQTKPTNPDMAKRAYLNNQVMLLVHTLRLVCHFLELDNSWTQEA